jgi:deoxyadenosine/deoxycytidine kinase
MIVSVDGAIAAGKSTLLDQLGSHYKVFKEPIEAWTLLEDFANDPKTHAYAFQIEILISYYRLRKKIAPNEVAIVERSPWSSKKVFFDMYIDCPLKREMYDDLYAVYGFEPDLILFLGVDEETSWKRVKKRGRPEENGYSEEHVKNVVQRYDAAIRKTKIPVVELRDCTLFASHAIEHISKHVVTSVTDKT